MRKGKHMDHVAIMRKSWGLTQKILTGQKKIESRWYKTKRAPFNRIVSGDAVYFKDSGEPVALKAEVKNVRQFSDLTEAKVREILNVYGKEDGIEKAFIPRFFQKFRNKKYCVVIFLKNAKALRPFKINKTGFGAMSPWIIIDDIRKIRV